MEKIEKLDELDKIMKDICSKEGIKKGIDIGVLEDSAMIYFTFVGGKNPYLNTAKVGMGEVFDIAKKYGLKRDSSCRRTVKDQEGRFYIRFKLKTDIY